MREKPVIAIDGPSGAGKSTVARGLAKALEFAFVDTGALYRAVAWLAHRQSIGWESGPRVGAMIREHEFSFNTHGILFVDGEEMDMRIRTPEMSLGASKVARLREVREALLEVQRRLGEWGGVVLEGRDIGTTVFPDADAKFFLTASTKVRARRRFAELQERGESVELSVVEKDQERRDQQDENRDVSPLRQAEDAIVIKCDDMNVDDVVREMIHQISFDF
jgi:cytidylate kinase